MNESKTPEWLVEAQNKSWEPEILISGITLTLLFLLSNYIFNFYGMLIQELSVRYVIGRNLYIVSIIILTGLKVGLILHLIFRGIWTGFVGLSYVFPDGVNKEKMRKSNRERDYPKPEQYVIKLEKICSLLFSFIFSSIMFVGATAIVFVPIALFYMTGLDVQYIKFIILFIFLPFVLIFGIYAILSETVFKKTNFKLKIANSILDNILNIYVTNIGIKKTALIFVLYFAFIVLLSLNDISKFDFNNEINTAISSDKNMVQLNKDHYQNIRDEKLRISKASIDQFWINNNTLELFISYYKEDLYTVQNLQEDISPLKELNIKFDSSNVSTRSLYQIYIDDKKITDLRWYVSENNKTDQKGIITTIPLDTLNNGYHELKLNKILWINKKKKIELIKNWDIIPFELEKNAEL